MSTLYRPARIGLILDRALGLYRANWRPIFGAALAVLFPAALLTTIGQVFAQRQLFAVIAAISSGDASGIQSVSQGAGWMQVLQLVGSLGSFVFGAAVLWVFVGILTVAPELAAGGHVTFKRLLTAGSERFWVALAVTVVVGLVALVPIAGAILAVFWELAVPAVVIEGASFERALGRSFRLVSRVGFWRTVLFLIAAWVVVIALEQLVQAPNVLRALFTAIRDPGALFQPMSVEWTVFSGLLSALALALASPFSMLATYLYYTDARARAEGMDLVQEARELAGGGAAA